MLGYAKATRLTVVATLSFAPVLAAQEPPKPVTSFTGDVGYVSASGNTRLTTLSAGDKIVHTNGNWAITQRTTYVYGETNAKETANQLRVSGRADYSFEQRVSVFVGTTYEHNRFAGFNSRVDEIAGLGWKAIVAPFDSITIEAGGGLTQEKDVDGSRHGDPTARGAANYKHVFSKTAYFQQLAEYVPNLQKSGAYRVNSESSLVAPISAHIGIKTGYAVRYDSRPPVNFGTTDRLLTMGVQVSF